MVGQLSTLTSGSLSRNPRRTLILLLVIIGSLVAFMTTEAAMRDLAAKSARLWSSVPYDMTITGPGAFSLSDDVKGTIGVRGNENSYQAFVTVNGFPGRLQVVGDGTLLSLRYESGRQPESSDEIAVDSFVAKRDRLEIGSEIRLTEADGEGVAATYKVRGITEECYFANVVVTAEGLARLCPSIDLHQTILVSRDAAIDLGKTKGLIAAMVKKHEGLRLIDDGESQYITDANVYRIAAVVSYLVLVAGIGSFLILLGLHQRDRSYELGVLRALGYNKIAIFIVLASDALVLIVAGFVLGLLGSVAVTSAMRLGNLGTLIARNSSSMIKISAASMLFSILVSLRTANSKVTGLLRVER